MALIEIDNAPDWVVSGARFQARCGQIRQQIEQTTSDYDGETLQDRLAKLSVVVAVIRVVGASEVEVTQRKDRVEDVLNATHAAVGEGIVPGGGSALIYAVWALQKWKGANEDQTVGINIVRNRPAPPLIQFFLILMLSFFIGRKCPLALMDTKRGGYGSEAASETVLVGR